MVYFVVNMVLQQKTLFNYGYCGITHGLFCSYYSFTIKTMVNFVVTMVLLKHR